MIDHSQIYELTKISIKEIKQNYHFLVYSHETNFTLNLKKKDFGGVFLFFTNACTYRKSTVMQSTVSTGKHWHITGFFFYIMLVSPKYPMLSWPFNDFDILLVRKTSDIPALLKVNFYYRNNWLLSYILLCIIISFL